MATLKNPGVPDGTEIVYLSEPFGGWVSSNAGAGTPPHYAASIEGRQGTLTKESLNQYAESDGISLFRLEKFGHIAPAQVYGLFTHANLNELPLNGVASSGGSFLSTVVLNNGRLLQIDASVPAYSAMYDATSHTPISSATPTNDVILFKDLASTPIEYVVWSWEWNGGAEVSFRLASTLGSGTDAWYSAISGIHTLAQGNPHKLCLGPDGNIYVTDGPYIQQVNITGAIASAAAGNLLNIGAGWTVTGIVPYKNYVAIIASNKLNNTMKGQTRVFLWNGLTTTINGVTSTAAQFIYDIPDNFGNGIFFDGLNLFALTGGRNNSSKIFELSSKGFIKVFESSLINPGTNSLQGSLEVYQDSLLVGVSAAKSGNAHLFRFFSGGLHDEGLITDGTNIATSVGMVKNLYNNELLIGGKYGSTYAIYHGTNANYQPNSALRTILFTSGILGRRMYPLGFKGTVNRIQIFLSQWGSGASLKIQLLKDYTPLSSGVEGTTLFTRNYTTTTYPSGTTEIDDTTFSFTNVSSFYAIITFNHVNTTDIAAIIRSIVFNWSPSQ